MEDWEIIEVMALPSRRRKGSVGMVQAYLRLKLLTGLRQRDLLRSQYCPPPICSEKSTGYAVCNV